MDIVTKSIKIDHVKELIPILKSRYATKKDFDKLEELIKELGLDEVEIIDKGFSGTEKGYEVDEDENTIIKYVSTISVDRDGDIVLPEGVILDDFNKHKVILYAHRHGADMFGGGEPTLPIGKDVWIKRDKFGLKAKQSYHLVTELSRNIYDMHRKGYPLASSIGFIVLESVNNDGGKEWKEMVKHIKDKYGMTTKAINSAKRVFTKTYLLEHSDCPVGSNPDALALAFQNGEVEFKSVELLKDLNLESEKEKNRIEELEKEVEKLDSIIESKNEIKSGLDENVAYLESKLKDKDAEIKRIKAEKPKFTKKDAENLINTKMKGILDHIDKLMGKV